MNSAAKPATPSAGEQKTGAAQANLGLPGQPTPANGTEQDELAQRARENAARVERGLAKADSAKGASHRPGVPPDYISLPPANNGDKPGELVGVEGASAPAGPDSARPAVKLLTPPAVAKATGKSPTQLPGQQGQPGSPPMMADVSDGAVLPPVVLVAGPVVGVGGPNRTGAAGVADPHRATANTGVSEVAPTGPGRTPNQTLAEAIVQAERLTAAQPNDFRLHLQLRMLYLAAGRTREAQAAWPAGSASDQKTLSAWVETAVALEASRSPVSSGQPGQVDPHEATLAAVERLRQQLAEQAALKVRTIKLASRVEGYGILTPFDGDVYRPGQWVIVYSELENLTSRLQTDGQYQSELSLRVEVLSAEGKTLLTQEDKQVVDKSLNQRRDFFLARRLRLPAEMTTGQYVLRVSVEDRLATKVGESMIRFQVK